MYVQKCQTSKEEVFSPSFEDPSSMEAPMSVGGLEARPYTIVSLPGKVLFSHDSWNGA